MNLPFRFAISDGAGNYWRVSGGVVSLNPTVKYLRPSVVDWATLSLNYRRDMVFLGVLRSYSPEVVRFVKDAATILRHIKNTQGGAEAKAYLAMYLYNKDQFRYDFLDYWQFDFSKSKNEELYYQVTLMDGGLSAALKSRCNNNYNIPLNDPALAPDFPQYNPLPANELPLTPPTNIPIPPAVPRHIYMDGIPILGGVQYTTNGVITAPATVNVAMALSLIGADNLYTIGLGQYNTLGDYIVGTTNIALPNKLTNVDAVNDTIIYRASPTNGSNITVSISYNLAFTSFNAITISPQAKKLQLKYTVFTGTPLGAWGANVSHGVIKEDSSFIPAGDTRTYHWVGKSQEFTLAPGQILAVGFAFVGAGTSSPSLTGGLAITINAPASNPSLQVPYIQLNTRFVPDSSVCRAISWGELFQQLTAYMATNGGLLSNAYSSRSNLLNTYRSSFAAGNWDLNPQCTFITCGDSLRGLKTNTIVDPYYNGGDPFEQYIVPAIHTNMTDFNKDLLVDLCASIGIERTDIGTDKLVAEDLYYFFDDNEVIADLGDNISDFVMEDFNDFRASGLIMGEEEQQFDSLNGPLVTNAPVDYATPITRIPKQIDLKSPYRTAAHGIELTRANIGNKTNINSSSDNDTFKLQTTGIVPIVLSSAQVWAGVSGYADTTEALVLMRAPSITAGIPSELLTPIVNPYAFYNLSFTTQRRARRAYPWLCSNYRGLVGGLMSITGYKKNIKLVSNLGSGDIAESDWLNISPNPITYTPPFATNPVTVAAPPVPAGRANNLLWLPYTFSFVGPAIKNLPLYMTPPGTPGGGKMYGKIKFTMTRGKKKYPLAGFVMDIGITPGTNATCNYKLLCSPTVVIPSDL